MSPQKESCKSPLCNKNVTKIQKSVGCAYCNNYFHLGCAKFSTELYNICLHNKVLKYICDACARMPKYCNVQEELRNGFAALTSSLEKDLEKKFLENKRLLENQLEAGLKAIEARFDVLAKKYSDDKFLGGDNLQSEIKNCYNMIKIIDNVATEKIKRLETENNISQRRLNRADIVIKGLPRTLKNLRKPIVKIASLCNVQLYYSDIQHCTYFEGGKSVLVKFNSVQIRDKIIINHRRNRNIILQDVIGGHATTNSRHLL
ncbi:hypothetical protein FF38_06728 [Lucilia cuprina]|uniref:Zinc finger PHD-type domain-containing protein n=1 Tax=Lucilia cuprina TaxID=7375 RepID=A0A0L0BTY9_LUCCU|nr:hypothetical protein FF38_06728 [Lucilia cuprina]